MLTHHLKVMSLNMMRTEEEPRKTELEFQPIHIATQRGYFEIVKLLIEKGSDIDNSVTSKAGRFRGQLCITRFFTR